MLTSMSNPFSVSEQSRIIEMAWEDRTPFEAIRNHFGLAESEVIKLMRCTLQPSSFRLWRKRVNGRKTKHLKRRQATVSRAYCPSQYKHRWVDQITYIKQSLKRNDRLNTNIQGATPAN